MKKRIRVNRKMRRKIEALDRRQEKPVSAPDAWTKRIKKEMNVRSKLPDKVQA